MDSTELKEIFKAQTKNVKRLKQAQKSLIKDINHYLKKNDGIQVETKTRILALLYSTLSEAQFIQITLTPFGFSEPERELIKTAKNKNIVEGWKTMIDIAMDKVRQNWNEVDDLQKRRDLLHELIDTYIGKPSLLRNKIAHGQWKIALNRENTAVNTALTSEIDTLNVVEITKWYEIHQFLCFIVRDLIQSPRKGFYNNYWVNLVNLQQFIDESASWTMQKRMEQLEVRKKMNIKA